MRMSPLVRSRMRGEKALLVHAPAGFSSDALHLRAARI